MTNTTNQSERPAPLCQECGKVMHRSRTKNPLCRDCERPFCPRCGIERVITVRSKMCVSCVTADDLRTPRRGQKASTVTVEDKQIVTKPKIMNSCRHQSDLPTYVAPEKAASYAQWAMKKRLCPDCYEREKRKPAISYEMIHRLPSLRGTDKQISWAKSIRYAKLQEFGAYVDQISRSATDPILVSRLREAHNKLAATKFASSWIDLRDLTLSEFASDCLASVSSV